MVELYRDIKNAKKRDEDGLSLGGLGGLGGLGVLARGKIFGFQGSYARNEPNCPKRGTEAVSGGPGGWGLVDCAKQTQFAPEPCEGQVLYGQRIMVKLTCSGLRQNKANSPISDCGLGIADCVERTQFRRLAEAPEGEMCKTKPNLRKPGYLGARWVETWGTRRVVQTKPISRGLIMETNSLRKRSYANWTQLCGCEKQSQFAPPDGHAAVAGANRATSPRCPASENKPNFRSARPLGVADSAKRTQFGGSRAGTPDPPGENDAKRTQFSPRPVARVGRLRQTNPISPAWFKIGEQSGRVARTEVA